MANICRLCLKEGDLISLFQSSTLNLAEKIMSFATINITPDDKLPSHICQLCAKKLNESYNFKMLCERSDWTLRKMLISKNFHISLEFKKENSPQFHKKSIRNETNYQSCEPNSSVEKSLKSIKSEKLSNVNMINVDLINTNTCHEHYKIVENNINKESVDNKGYKSQQNTNILNLENQKPILYYDDTTKIEDDETKSNEFENDIFHNNSIDKISELFPLNKHKEISKNCIIKIKNSKSKNNDKVNKEQCFTCGKVMSSRFRLKMHLRIHTGEKPFTCNYCNKQFALSQNLKVHERTHTGEKPLKCNICGKAFAQSAGLVAHMRLHTGETPYKCTLCPMKFRTPGHLQYHVRQHTGEKKFECDICNRAFITKGDLTQHIKIHTGERPYICTICGLRMSRSSHLTRHMMTHTGEKPHRCEICGLSYAQKGDLARHLKRHPNGICKNVNIISDKSYYLLKSEKDAIKFENNKFAQNNEIKNYIC